MKCLKHYTEFATGGCPECKREYAEEHAHQTDASTGASEPVVAADTRIVPATPLPWRAISRNDLLAVGERKDLYWEIEAGRGYFTHDLSENTGFCLSGYVHQTDARYIVHAANAYPKLVRILKDATFEIKRNVGQMESEAYGNALLLLRELGELK